MEKQQRDVCAVSLHPACASSRRCSRPAGRGEIAECVAKPVVRCAADAIARRPTSTSRSSTLRIIKAIQSFGPPATRSLSAWHSNSPTADTPGDR